MSKKIIIKNVNYKTHVISKTPLSKSFYGFPRIPYNTSVNTTNTSESEKPAKVNAIKVFKKLVLSLLKRASIFILTFIATLLILDPIADNYTGLINRFNDSLDYDFNASGVYISPNDARNFEMRGENPNSISSQYTYDFNAVFYLKINRGTLKSAYLVYPNYDQTVSEQNFHKINATKYVPKLSDALKDSIWAGIRHKEVSKDKYSEVLNINQHIEYSRNKENLSKNSSEPLYLVLIDKFNHISIKTIAVKAKPVSSQEVEEVSKNGKAFGSLKIDSNPYQPIFKFYDSEDILDAQSEDTQSKLWVNSKQYAKDSKKIQSVIKEYFFN
ncbi:hypothetical protein [Lactococcus lactis]|uniref:hypothetical protein n=1 Tax=Lactococcus lactis TaxID=1358 RepID=UPI0018C7B2B3|nr:hypothetical protein [Lactococcus lactis]MBG1279300.1 hypothetical protein [Lactococcus lactis subsp. lactis]